MKIILRFLSVIFIKYLQRKYKSISIENRYNQTNQVLSKLKLIQSILYFFKSQFNAWGYFHPDCSWSENDEKQFRKLFPQKDFEELEIVVWYNPEAVTYYHNKIFDFTKGATPIYSSSIKNQLIKWKNWN